MKIKIYRYELPHRSGLLIYLEEEGKSGWGEIAPLAGYSKETLEQATAQAKELVTHGRAKLLSHLLPSVAWGLQSALAAMQRKPSPLRIPVAGLLQGTVEQIWRKAERLEKQGVGCVKLKAGNLPLEAVVELLSALQRRFSLRIDAARRWSLRQVLQIASCLSPGALDYFEEPLQDIEALSHFPHPFALDETLRSPEAERFFPLPQLKGCIVKPMLTGGVGKYPRTVLSHCYETGIGIASLANCAPIRERPMGLDTSDYFESDLLTIPLCIEQGHLCVPAKVEPRRECLHNV